MSLQCRERRVTPYLYFLLTRYFLRGSVAQSVLGIFPRFALLMVSPLIPPLARLSQRRGSAFAVYKDRKLIGGFTLSNDGEIANAAVAEGQMRKIALRALLLQLTSLQKDQHLKAWTLEPSLIRTLEKRKFVASGRKRVYRRWGGKLFSFPVRVREDCIAHERDFQVLEFIYHPGQ